MLDLSSYFSFQIISTREGEDKDDGDDEGTSPEHSVNKALVDGGGLSRRGRRDVEEGVPGQAPSRSSLDLPVLPPPSIISPLSVWK